MKYFWLSLPLLLILLGCQKDWKPTSNIQNYIPENATVILKTNSLQTLESAASQNQLITEVLTYPELHHFENVIKPLTHIKPQQDCLLALSKDQNDSLEISIITKYHSGVFEPDSIPNSVSTTFSSKSSFISKHEISNNIYYSSVIDSVLFISNRLKLVESAFQPKTQNPKWDNLLSISKQNKSASICIDLKKEPVLSHFFKTSDSLNLAFSNFLCVDVDLSQNDILMNGITKSADSSKSLINVFKNTIPQENKMATIAPDDTERFMSLTFNDFKVFNDQLFKHTLNTPSQDIQIFDTVNEVGIIELPSGKVFVFNAIDSEASRDNFSQNQHSTFRSYDIYNLENESLFEKTFYPFFTSESLSYYTIINDFFVFSENIDVLESLISSFQNNSTLAESKSYKDVMANLSDESSIFIYMNPTALNTVTKHEFNDDKNLDLNSYQSSALQFVYDADFAHVNAAFKSYKPKAASNAISEDFNISIDESITSDIQLVDNHTNNQKDIVVQDASNTIYLISNQGKIFWKKQLNGKILGKIEQIDMYKNGRLQLAFATANKVYVLDRNGRDVAPFPLDFNDPITQPLSVFDYDNNRNYRLMVTQGKEVLMYDQRGKTVSGFKYSSAKNTISTQPKHFRIGRKDYIVFADGNQMEVLSRVGKRRINVKEPIYFSGNEIYLYKNKFATTNTSGELLEVNQNGKVNHKNLRLNETHFLTTTSKTLVALSENKLTIKTNTIDLDFGDYTAPRIFYINDKIYVSVTDKQAKKVYLFDSQAKAIKNFPVYGTSSVVMDNIDRDAALEILVKGDKNSIIVYELH